ncbi:hypothetical protein GCM10022251_25360 [Phytohabitans flavus]|uniref:Uncharacterized protein n=1 Tax=Phytohabitans flavus TaxID=1076124 RepID=A0A6F8XR20_9ACTN|nr:WXG100 family type VII secretion target [Phytohabitans flavus]BCB76260.1 hypothetical protein Pflav_026700 [Phytohabitans flavus]
MNDDSLFVKYDGMEQSAGTLVQVAKTLETEVTTLEKRLAAVDWSDGGREEFEILMRRWRIAYRNLVAIVHSSGGTVRDVSGLYNDVETWGKHAFHA